MSLDPIFSPRSVAVIGASQRRDSLGYALVHNLLMNEFAGTIYPVNPKSAVIHSLRCYPSVGSIPDPVDLAVILVPRAVVAGVVEECLEKGVRGLVVITAGFREVGPEGAALERRIVARVREAGVRLIGPNCMGVINADPDVRLNATFAPAPAHPGSVGFVSQSGALGVAILNVAASLGIGFTQFASMGNKADVSGNDLLEYWEHDERTRVIAMYLESFGNPRKFTQIAKRIGRSKPILVVKSGRTAAGERAASSHTGALAGADVTVSAFLEQCGVIRANTIEEMFAIAQALDKCPLPAGPRIAIVTNAGGPAIMATDACVSLGLEIAALSDQTADALRRVLPENASLNNPVDMIAAAGAPEYEATVSAVLRDPGVDMVLAIHVMPLTSTPMEILTAITQAARTAPDKPVAVVMMATEEAYAHIRNRPDLVPIYEFPESAALALSKLAGYAAWRARDGAQEVERFDGDDARVESLLDTVSDGYLPPDAAFGVLEAYGIPTAPWSLVQTKEEAIEAASRIGYPVVLKAVGAELVHKSDVGGVEVDLRTDGELAAAITEMSARIERAGLRADQFLVQKLIKGGHELIFGVSSDPRMGPILMFGLGGKYVEVFHDVRFGIPPISRSEARGVVRGLRGHRLLEGVRGEDPVDEERLVDILLRIAQLVDRHPRIVEMDINPWVAFPRAEQSRAVDVRIRVAALPRGPLA